MLAGCVFALVLWDPYTLHRDASDMIQPGPWWQMLLGMTDLVLLGYVLIRLWKHDPRNAFRILAAETLLALA
jgi:hypothetical protein